MTLRKGRLVDAVRASMAIPFVFAPWPVDERLLADGYLSDPLPSNVASREEADVIIALGFDSPYQQTLHSPLRYAFQLSSIMSNSIYKARVAFHTMVHHADVLLLTPDFRQSIGFFDAEMLPAIIAAGEQAMAEQLPYLQTAIRSPVVV